MDIIFSTWVIIIPSVIIIAATYFSLLAESKAKVNILFGVSIPLDKLTDESVKKVVSEYKKSLNIMAIICLLLLIPSYFLIDNKMPIVLYFTAWIIGCIYFMSSPFSCANKKLNIIKKTNTWLLDIERGVLIDTKVSRVKNTFPIRTVYFVVSIIFSLAIFMDGNKIKVTDIKLAIFAVCTTINLIALMFYLVIIREKTKVYSKNTEINLSINKKIKRSKSAVILMFTFLNSIYSILLAFFIGKKSNNSLPIFIMSIILISLVLIMILLIDNMNKKYTSKLLENDEHVIESDDDNFWKNGTIYNNPNDNVLFAPKRNGIGYTINTGTKKGKIVFTTVIASVVVLIMVVVGLVFSLGTTTPTIIIDKYDTIQINSSLYNYYFSLDDIISIEIIDDITILQKNNGINTSEYARGNFTVKEYGKVKLYTYVENKTNVLIKLKDDNIVIYNEKDYKSTKNVYDMIIKSIN